MKAYIITTGAIFGLITIAHILRIIFEHSHFLTDPVYMLLTLVSASLCFWAWRVLRRLNG